MGCNAKQIGVRNWRAKDKFQVSFCYIHLCINTLAKGMNPFPPQAMGQIVGLVSGKIIVIPINLLMHYSLDKYKKTYF